MTHITIERLRNLLDHARNAEIAVLGDVMLDRYFWGEVTRISPEAPVPVVDVSNESFHLGGAANVACNLHAIGVVPRMYGIVGNDASGKMFLQVASDEYLDTSGIIISQARPTTVKTRVIGNNQQLIRLDRETRGEVTDEVVAQVVKDLERRSLAGIVFEDYDKGFLSDALITRVIEVAKQHNIPVLVDPKRTVLAPYRQCFVYKPNRKEAQEVLGMSMHHQDDILKAGSRLLDILRCDNVLITLGSAGMMLFERDGSVSSVPTTAKRVADVSGAGDTAIAVLAAMVAGGATIREAATVANIAAGVVVGEPGIVAITPKMLEEGVLEHVLHYPE